MRRKGGVILILAIIVSLFLSMVLSPVTVYSGQVVTKEIKEWARKALEEEKTLKGTEGENTITVLYFVSDKKDPLLVPLQKGLAIMLITDLKKLEKFNVVDRVRLQALLEEMKLSESGLVDENTKIKLGKLMKARWIVGGELNREQKEQLKILSQVLDTPEKKILGNPGVEGLYRNLLKLEKELLFEIVELLNVKLTPKQREILAQPVTLNMDALLYYFKGIDASDNGDYEKAAGYYKEAAELDPDFQLPKLALSELFELHLVKEISPRLKRKRSLARSLRGSVSLTDTLVTEAPMKRLKKPKEAKAPEEKPVEDEDQQVVLNPDNQNNNQGAMINPVVGGP